MKLDSDTLMPAEKIAATARGDKAGTSLSKRMHDLRENYRRVFGIPDYERYLAHAALRHPGQPVLSRRAFCAQAIEHKYGNRGARCC